MGLIYIPNGKAFEYSPLAMNVYTNCPHGCLYCYNKHTPYYRDVPTAPRKNFIKTLKREVVKNPGKGQSIHLCFTCDPFPFYINQSVTREALEILCEADYKPSVLTKNPAAAMECLDYISRLGVTFSSIKYAGEWEPNAPFVGLRMGCIAYFKAMGVYTWVSLEPVLSMDVLNIVDDLKNQVDYWKIGKLNHHNKNMPPVPEVIDWPKFRETISRILPRGNYMFKADTEPLTLGRSA